MRVNEIFESEGRYLGLPVLFIRLSGCTRKCKWCDSKYHIRYKEMTINMMVRKIKQSKKKIIVWTGGEPTLQFNFIKQVIDNTENKWHHLESNGDLMNKNNLQYLETYFDYVCISPKDLKTTKKVVKIISKSWYKDWDIKIVTDLDKVGIDMLSYATLLMPLTTYNKEKDAEIRKKVWKYCVKNNLFYSARLHIDIFGKKKGV